MLEITEYKKDYDCVLESAGLRRDEVAIFCESDMNRDLTRGNSFLAVTGETLTVTEGRIVLAGGKKRFPPRGTLLRGYQKTDAREYRLSGLSEMKVEAMISSVRLTALYGGETVVLAVGTFAVRGALNLLAKYTERLQKEGRVTPDEADFSEQLFCPKCHRRYPDPVRKVCPRCVDKVALLKKFWIFIKKYRPRLYLILFAYLAVSLMGVIVPYFSSAFFYDRVILNPEDPFYGKLLPVVSIVAGVSIASILVQLFGNIVTAKMAGQFIYDLKITIFESMKKLSMDFFTGRQTGGLMTQINRDANSIYWFFVDGFSYYIVTLLQFVAVAVIMFTLEPLLAFLCVVVLPLFFFAAAKMLTRENYYHMKLYSGNRQMNAQLSDSLGALRVIKAFAKEKEEGRHFAVAVREAADAWRNVTVFNNAAYPALNALVYTTTLLVWGVGGWMAMTGRITYGFLTAFVAYSGLLNAPTYSLVGMTDYLSDCINAMQRLFEIYEAEPTVREAESPVVLPEMRGEIEFRHVSFSYEKNRKIIDDVSFTVGAGSRIGLVGHSGAGKSTLANLLIRLYDAGEGEILIDGVNVKQLSFRQLRENVGIVSQETYLFEGTLYENIGYARPDASREEIIAAARLAGAHEFIVKLPDGYQTVVGTGHKQLSGGERQRISIARAVLLNPKILILDEATAAMDTRTERAIQDALDRLSEGRTTIMIAHRLSTLSRADRLIVIEKGRLEESGTHRELMSRDGIYRRLYNLQLEAMRNVLEEGES